VFRRGVLEVPDLDPATTPGMPDRAGVRLLFVGRGDPYKNLEAAVRAMAILAGDPRRGAELTVVGGRDERYPGPWQLADTLGVAGRMRALGPLSEDELAREYARADVLVAPSRYEGFGLPPLEAMASGLPVVCTRAGSLPEVVGDAALFCDPDDAASIADAVVRIADDPGLRAGLVARGRERAELFRWDTAARKTLEVYRMVRGETM
jgi:alpha-1,3-rhamnosyl/mannosyltransferase